MFNALLATKDDDQHRVAVTQIDKGTLADSGVLIKVDYSTINYKDALAVTATAPIIRKYPLVPGIDLARSIPGTKGYFLMMGAVAVTANASL